MRITWKKHTLQFLFSAGTSRGAMHTKDTYYLIGEQNAKYFYGECSLLKGLSIDPLVTYESKLDELCTHLSQRSIQAWHSDQFIPTIIDELKLNAYPSILMGLEILQKDFVNGCKRLIFDTPFYNKQFAIPINGLVWMNSPEHMLDQAHRKIQQGYTCIKLKVGAIDFEKECWVLDKIRSISEDVELRLDANGAFTKDDVWQKLETLAKFNIHSIEQPVQPKQYELMHQLSLQSMIPIVLDEELIGHDTWEDKDLILKAIQPRYIIVKPSLIGGFQSTEEWIRLCEKHSISWWATSALESNIGLNAIAQFTSTHRLYMPQGLGTGMLYSNNIDSPLEVINGTIRYNQQINWDYKYIHP
jgi:L-alanine-DL-glutamate epimerase-like enolase superfamily enzyme